MTARLVIFDLDDTLINFAATRLCAHQQLTQVLAGEQIDAAAYIQAHSEIDRLLFQQFEQGKITRAEYRVRRFHEPFDRLRLVPREGLVAHLNEIFMTCVNDSPQLYDDVWPILDWLKQRSVRTAILTNGPSDGQRRKLKATGLADQVDLFAIGEEIGFSKPHAAAYEAVTRQLGIDHASTWMIGDSPALDYDGARNAGLSALLLDRDGTQPDASRRTIRSLSEIAQAITRA
jgi:HAD superfamily hydrolase (TIGR01549 family)